MNTAFLLRPATKTDIPGIAAVINASSKDVLGTPLAIVRENGQLRQLLYIEEGSEEMVVTTPAGRIVGYQSFYCEEPYITSEVGGFVHPEYRNQGVGTLLLDWAEQRAQQASQKAPLGAKTILAASCFDTNQHTIRLLEKRGHAFIHTWIHLEIRFSHPPLSPTMPAGITIRPLNWQADWPAVIQVLNQAFRDHWGTIEESGLEFPATDQSNEVTVNTVNEQLGLAPETEDNYDPYSNSPGLCFVALDGDRIVGSCLCTEKTTEWENTGYLGSLTVHPDYRRRGIGLALTQQALRTYYERGYERVVTDTDIASFTGANQLYIKTGMQIYRRQNTYEKTIRVGREIRALRVEDMA